MNVNSSKCRLRHNERARCNVHLTYLLLFILAFKTPFLYNCINLFVQSATVYPREITGCGNILFILSTR